VGCFRVGCRLLAAGCWLLLLLHAARPIISRPLEPYGDAAQLAAHILRHVSRLCCVAPPGRAADWWRVGLLHHRKCGHLAEPRLDYPGDRNQQLL
jgi:hypothetical protein